MKRNQMLWAQQHDWFIDARQVQASAAQDEALDSSWEVICSLTFTAADGTTGHEIFITTDYAELRAWAGY